MEINQDRLRLAILLHPYAEVTTVAIRETLRHVHQ